MSLSVQVNGQVYDDAISIRYSRSLMSFCGSYEVEASANETSLLPVKLGNTVKVLADGVQVLTGYIDRLNVSMGEDDHTISFSGRDRTCDILDSTVSGTREFEGAIYFSSVLKNVLNAGNMSHIGIDNETGFTPEFAEGEIISAENDDTIFDFIEPYAAKLGFILTTNEAGNVLMCKASGENLGFNLLHEKDNNENNILSSQYSIDNEKRFNKYTASSQQNPYGMGEETTPDMIVEQEGETSTDSEIRASRILNFNVEEDADNATDYSRAEFEKKIRAAKAMNYVCTIQGHSFNGVPFKINRIAFVKDDFANIASNLLLHTVDMQWSLAQGSISRLGFSYKNAFELKVLQDQRDASRSLTGDDFY